MNTADEEVSLLLSTPSNGICALPAIGYDCMRIQQLWPQLSDTMKQKVKSIYVVDDTQSPVLVGLIS